VAVQVPAVQVSPLGDAETFPVKLLPVTTVSVKRFVGTQVRLTVPVAE
jgi:hypothetical protein